MLEYFNLIWIVSSIVLGVICMSFLIFVGFILEKLKMKEDYFLPFIIINIVGIVVFTLIMALAPANDFYRYIKQ